MTSNPAAAFQSIKTNYTGLGDSPIGNYVREQAPLYNERTSDKELMSFIIRYTRNRSDGRPVEAVATEMGFDCKNSPELVCKYDGVYTYELGRLGFPNKRGAVLISFLVNFGNDQLEVHTSRKFLYGGIEN